MTSASRNSDRKSALQSRFSRLLRSQRVPTVACALFVASNLLAQNIPSKPTGSVRLSGFVTDTTGVPIANANVVVESLGRRTRSALDGSFRFEQLEIGTYSVSVQSVGFRPSAQVVSVGGDGSVMAFRLSRSPNVLPAMVTSGSRGGLSGVVGDTAFRAIGDVKVTVLGTGHAALTDTCGSFFVPLRPGQYLLRFERDGFARQLVSVTIPDNEGRRLAAWMVPKAAPDDAFKSHMLFEMDQRMVRERGIGTAYFGREELDRIGASSIEGLAQRFATSQIADCMVRVNGGPTMRPLWALSASELEFVEVYLPSLSSMGKGRKSGSRSTSTSMRPATSKSCGNLGIIVWLRD